ncbi:acyl-CoA desaturase [Paraferrimonas sedimenticola]|uniref:Acyl-CoA desaturase n=1 Tax=Paraferrimonas sedimenticola TaxID=375674 RepID=A0AA37VXD8_9GAMM|nr:fatty acid desaturase [Paraferrimonas sedimenticola]GLP95245.1 acyl-CoA desaturase [Paraferrimonas sedimenticola]
MKKPPLIWLNLFIFIGSALIALVGAPMWAYQVGFSGIEIGVFVAFILMSGLSITAGYHRLWSHKAYQANPVVRFVFALGGALALQNSALHWSSDHRRHHKHVDDNEKDPYSAKMGFFYSHIGWMIREYHSQIYHDYSNCKDLKKDKIVQWQHKHYLKLAFFMNILLPMIIGYFTGSVLGMLILAGVTRLFLVHHSTFFINSLAHIWGRQPYTARNTAMDNDLLALLTFGEGYHNFHHIFEYDYRNGIRWYQFDPTKWLIWALSKVGLANKLRRTPQERIEAAKAKMQLQRQTELARKLGDQSLLEVLEAEYEVLVERLTAYYQAKREKLGKDSQQKLAQLKQALQQQQQLWRQLQLQLPQRA